MSFRFVMMINSFSSVFNRVRLRDTSVFKMKFNSSGFLFEISSETVSST